jgi:hypothetical protein
MLCQKSAGKNRRRGGDAVKLTAPQTKALKMLSLGVSINLRLYFTRATVTALLERGLILESLSAPDAPYKREHTITAFGADIAAISPAFPRVSLTGNYLRHCPECHGFYTCGPKTKGCTKRPKFTGDAV